MSKQIEACLVCMKSRLPKKEYPVFFFLILDSKIPMGYLVHSKPSDLAYVPEKS
jgi:hypothetical protein